MYANGVFAYNEAGDEVSMKTIAAAIEFGTSKIVTLIAESSGFSSSRCNIIGSGTVPYDGYSIDETGENVVWNKPEGLFDAIERSIRAAESKAKRSIQDIYVGVPCENIFVRTAISEVDVQSPDERITFEDISNVMDAAADQLGLIETGLSVLHRSPAWFKVDGGKNMMRPQNCRGKKLQAQVSFIVADTNFIEDVRNLMGDLGITVNAFLAPTMGAAMLLIPFDERDRNSVVLIDAGYLNTELSVIEGDGITYHAVLPMGGVDITLALQEGLGIGMKEAETIKRRFNFKPDQFEEESDFEVRYPDGTVITLSRKFIQDTIENECSEMIKMIDQTLEYAKEHISPRSPIYLTGGGLQMRGFKDYMGNQLGHGIKLPVARAAQLNHPWFASALGLMDLVMDLVSSTAGRWNSAAAEESGTASGFTKMFRGQQTK